MPISTLSREGLQAYVEQERDTGEEIWIYVEVEGTLASGWLRDIQGIIGLNSLGQGDRLKIARSMEEARALAQSANGRAKLFTVLLSPNRRVAGELAEQHVEGVDVAAAARNHIAKPAAQDVLTKALGGPAVGNVRDLARQIEETFALVGIADTLPLSNGLMMLLLGSSRKLTRQAVDAQAAVLAAMGPDVETAVTEANRRDTVLFRHFRSMIVAKRPEIQAACSTIEAAGMKTLAGRAASGPGHSGVRRATGIPPDLAATMERGMAAYEYKGIRTWKCPFDLTLYSKLIWELKPGTIFEIGSKFGGSAVWFADTLRTFGLGATRVHSFDIEPVRDVTDPGVDFRYIDTGIRATYPSAEFLAACPKPWLLIDDASHRYRDVLAVLEFFHDWLQPGDYVIVEDGMIHHLDIAANFEGGPLRAIEEFLDKHADRYAVDRAYCDFYGENVTWNIDGYLRRVA